MKIEKLIFLILLTYIGLPATLISQSNQFKALVVTTTRGWHHESIHTGVLAIQELGKRNYFDVTIWDDPDGFTDKYMEQFQVVIFLNTTGDIFDSKQKKVMERFIQSGKGFVGIHSASDTEYDWEWYTKLVGRMFYIHPVIQTAKVYLTDSTFPGLQGFAPNKLWTDEEYEFGPEKIDGLKYILAVDEQSYDPKVEWKGKNKKGVGMGKFHPLSWYHDYDGGRSFYTALGHLPAVFGEPAFLDHIYAGIYWAALGRK